MDTRDYLATVKRRHFLESDYALAKLMGVSRQLVSMWQTSHRTLDNANCFKVADLLELPPQLVIADIERERAQRAGKTDEADRWAEWAKRLASFAAAAIVGAAITGPGPARASIGAGSGPISSDEYTLSRLRRRRGDVPLMGALA